MKKVLFISNIGLSKKTEPNGVNIKNRHILKYLSSMQNTKIITIDTENWKLRIIPLFIKIIFHSFICKKIILSINTKSAYQVIKFLNFIKMENKLIYMVVGGNLHGYIENGTLNIKYFKNILKIFVESKKMDQKLRQLGLKNTKHLPNSKYYNEIQIDYNRDISLPIKCFYLGRIHPDKGIDMIFEALSRLNKNDIKIKVDFYGPIHKTYKYSFLQKVDMYSFAEYRGIIDLVENSENYQKLSTYDLFLFPTFWHGEGFPGVVLDSFISGVPVLASDWNHNTEIIQDEINGIIFKTKSINDFIAKLNDIVENPNILLDMRKNAHIEARKYHSQNVLKVLDYLIYKC